MAASTLPSFPSATDALHSATALAEMSLAFRRASDLDVPWLRELYASTREDELSLVSWPDATKRAFAASQFELQHRHFVAYFSDADFLIVERAGQPVGRLYIQRGNPLHIVDIALLTSHRDRGLGSALLRWVMNEARALGRDLTLHVANNNPRAFSLYRKLGFDVEPHDSASHLKMRWSPRK